MFSIAYRMTGSAMDAEDIGKSEAACRQILHRAKGYISENRPRFDTSAEMHREIFESFLQAIGTGDPDSLMTLMVEDVDLWADGGGKVREAATRPIYGQEAVAQFLLGSMPLARSDTTLDVEEINGNLAIILRSDGEPYLVMTFDIREQHIHALRLSPTRPNYVVCKLARIS